MPGRKWGHAVLGGFCVVCEFVVVWWGWGGVGLVCDFGCVWVKETAMCCGDIPLIWLWLSYEGCGADFFLFVE